MVKLVFATFSIGTHCAVIFDEKVSKTFFNLGSVSKNDESTPGSDQRSRLVNDRIKGVVWWKQLPTGTCSMSLKSRPFKEIYSSAKKLKLYYCEEEPNRKGLGLQLKEYVGM